MYRMLKLLLQMGSIRPLEPTLGTASTTLGMHFWGRGYPGLSNPASWRLQVVPVRGLLWVFLSGTTKFTTQQESLQATIQGSLFQNYQSQYYNCFYILRTLKSPLNSQTPKGPCVVQGCGAWAFCRCFSCHSALLRLNSWQDTVDGVKPTCHGILFGLRTL